METLAQNPFDSINKDLQSLRNEIVNLKNIVSSSSRSEKKYYSIADAAKKLGVASITIYRGVESGKIPGKRVGQRLLIPSSFVDEQ